MTTFTPIYRLEIRAPRSVDSTEATILTPIGAAPHSDAFKVSTATLAGYKAYLEVPRGAGGRIDPLTKRTTIGEMTFRVLDERTTVGGSNLSRWVTAFVGNTKKKAQFGGLKLFCEESTDDGSTWSSFFTGRIHNVTIVDKIWWEFRVRDMSVDFDIDVFVGTPESSITYATRASLLPLGFVTGQSYSGIGVSPKLTGAMIASTVPTTGMIEVDGPSATRLDMTVTKILKERLDQVNQSVVSGPITLPEAARVFLKRTDTSAEGIFRLVGLNPRSTQENVGTPETPILVPISVRELMLAELPTTDTDYAALSGFPATTAVEFHVEPFGPLRKETPLYIDEVHPAQLWKDILDGKFSLLDSTDGSVRFTFAYDSTAFTNLIADTSIPNARFIIREKKALNRFIEEQICQPFNLAYTLNGDGEVVPIDMRLPNATPSVSTIANADLAAEPEPEIEFSRDMAITVLEAEYSTDEYITPQRYGQYGDPPDLPAGAVISRTALWQDLDFGDPDLGDDRKFRMDIMGLRVVFGGTYQSQASTFWVQRTISGLFTHLRRLFGGSAYLLTLPLRRTANTNGMIPGDYKILDIDELADPATVLRGGARLGQALEVYAEGPRYRGRFLDVGQNLVSVAPTMGTVPAQEGGNTRHGVTITVTLNVDTEPATFWFAITATSVGTRPAETSPLWTFAHLVTASATQTIRNLPNNMRVWVRSRSETPHDGTDQFGGRLPSVWAYPSVTGYVDTAAIGAETSLAAGSLTDRSAVLTWAVATSTDEIEVLLVTPTTDPQELIATLPIGSTRLKVTGLAASTTYRAWVRHKDRFGGRGTEATVDFTTTAVAPSAAPALRGIYVIQGDTS